VDHGLLPLPGEHNVLLLFYIQDLQKVLQLFSEKGNDVVNCETSSCREASRGPQRKRRLRRNRARRRIEDRRAIGNWDKSPDALVAEVADPYALGQRQPHSAVMPGLVPEIHAVRRRPGKALQSLPFFPSSLRFLPYGADIRDKPRHDGWRDCRLKSLNLAHMGR
jgi:hypothetical protein